MLSGRSSIYARSLFQKVSATPLDKSVSRDIVSCRAVIRASRGDGFAIRRQYFDTWKTAPFLPHEKAKMPHECPRFHVMSAGSHNRHSLFWVKGLQLFFELILPGATFHLTSTFDGRHGDFGRPWAALVLSKISEKAPFDLLFSRNCGIFE